MEIDITELVSRAAFDPWELFNSKANLGDGAGTVTYDNAKRIAESPPPLLATDAEKEAFLGFVAASGGWTKEEIAAWSHIELVTLFIQWVAGDIREGFGDYLPEDFKDWDWAQYEKDSERGQCASTLFQNDGKLYFDLSL